MSGPGRRAELPLALVRAEIIGRAVLLVLVVAIAVTQGRPLAELTWVALLFLAGLLSAASRVGRASRLLLLSFEAAAGGVVVIMTNHADSPYLPYLLAPAVAGALRHGLIGAVVPAGWAAVALLTSRAVAPPEDLPREFYAATAQWVVLAALAGALAHWLTQITRRAPEDEVATAQREAYDLLRQLRVVARRLPGSLDPASTAESLLAEARSTVDFTDGAVLARADGARLVPLARLGRVESWDTSLAGDTSISEVWASQQPQVRDRRVARTDGSAGPGSSLVVPLVSGHRTFGLIVLEGARPRLFSPPEVEIVRRSAAELSMQLETALLFDEVRTLATAEERQRVAREVHDGIAQELVFLGYSLDAAIEDARGEATDLLLQLEAVRTEVTRIVSEVRMSIYDLRTELDATAGLGTALGEHVRMVGTRTGLTVHVTLSESPMRLPISTEVELLRIAQEAIANARKHARAQNLWVSCTVDPPEATLVVEDDGVGLSAATANASYGLTIMRERAARIGATLKVGDRRPRGARVEVRLTGQRVVARNSR